MICMMNPERLHQVLNHMAESKADLLDRLEREHRLFDNRTNVYTGSGGLGYLNVERKPPQEVLLRICGALRTLRNFPARIRRDVRGNSRCETRRSA